MCALYYKTDTTDAINIKYLIVCNCQIVSYYMLCYVKIIHKRYKQIKHFFNVSAIFTSKNHIILEIRYLYDIRIHQRIFSFHLTSFQSDSVYAAIVLFHNSNFS